MEKIEKKKDFYTFEDLIEVMDILRSDTGCPWDREQNHESIKANTLEEAYEVVEAINNKDMDNLREELGDLLLHVVFHSKIAKDNNDFNIEDVINELVEKLIRRHPHVFDNANVTSSSKVNEQWEDIKKTEKKHTTVTETIKSVPLALPSLVRAYKVQKKAARVGFDFPSAKEAYHKFEEEIAEFEQVIKSEEEEAINEEFGDILFSLVNISRFFRLNPEICLTNAIEKFINRFEGIEKQALDKGKTLEDLSLAEMDELWETVKIVTNNLK